ncbi:MAG TPA: DEAD/DEAH box helicase [Chlamydiales bacterium]|nr:DEAD/DEAH box helicase [Chlamydiales bacterium]
MLNFRKLKADFSSNILKEGKQLHDQSKVVSAKILRLDPDVIRLHAKILGNFDNTYESEIEIDRFESQTVHSNCDCPYRYDCQHLAALMFFLEEKLDSLIVQYSKEADIADLSINKEEKKDLMDRIKEAETKEAAKKDKHIQKELLEEYVHAAEILSFAPFFLSQEENIVKDAEVAFLFNPASLKGKIEFQMALRLPSRSKPLQIVHLKQFLDALRFEESIFLGGKKYLFSYKSFSEIGQKIIKGVAEHVKFQEPAPNERAQKSSFMEPEAFGLLLALVHESAETSTTPRGFMTSSSDDLPALPCLYFGNLETPLRYSPFPAVLRFQIEHIGPPSPKLFLKPTILIDQNVINLEESALFECAKPGLIYQDTYFRFPPHIKRTHLKHLSTIVDMTIPEPLFGTFVENALPQMKRYAEIAGLELIEKFVTVPFAGNLEAKCELSYLDGELEAQLKFFYEGHPVPASISHLQFQDIMPFLSPNGILARNLVEERQLVEEIFQDFVFNPQTGSYVAKTEKKIVEFMTEIVPRNQNRVKFDCPQNLLDQFIYDQTTFTLALDYEEKVGFYTVDLKVDGALKGVKLDLLWECIAVKRTFIELDAGKKTKKDLSESRFSKILVLDLEKTGKLVQLFDELGIQKLDNHKEERPLWSLVTIDSSLFEGLPVKFTISSKLQDIRKQMLGEKNFDPLPVPKTIQAQLRPYQLDGVHWLQKLRLMYLNGILADDMGLGKTLQAIIAITQHHSANPGTNSLIICPTSLLYNWKEEIHKFNPKLTVQVIEGIPNSRKKLLSSLERFDISITSYTLLQKDIEQYRQYELAYVILDEAQNIKNRGTRNAKSVKMIRAQHRLILTGTPIENSLDELWSLFDFLMPGLLSTYDRFVEKYVRSSGQLHTQNMEYLRKKVSPFILRRMKSDVLQDLPPVSEIVYHCQLSKVQQDLYSSYAASARDELTKLVARDGFDKVQIHVLATLTRLKQICCHPAIFAKQDAEEGDSAKYDMLLELLQTLVEGGHKTVIFSQYTRMLDIMRQDFEQRGIRFSYLDGSSKNRLQIAKEFNEDKQIPVFLVSLKAGGTGLNLVGADTVIHYDMWWNPAVENQATDRVHRLGQKNSVSSYKLITLNTIEEKIVEMQRRKKGLVKKVVSCDDEAIAKLTWEDVLELLQA